MVISLGGQTYAQKAARLLRQNRIRSELVKIDSGRKRGCVWGLQIGDADSIAAAGLLRNAGIAYEHADVH